MQFILMRREDNTTAAPNGREQTESAGNSKSANIIVTAYRSKSKRKRDREREIASAGVLRGRMCVCVCVGGEKARVNANYHLKESLEW